jgi:signal peptidase I
MSEPQQTEIPTPWWLRVLFGRRPKRTLIRLLVLVAACIFIFKFVLIPIRVTGTSMEPTYRNGAINFINRWAYTWHPIRRGDVVGIQYVESRVLLLKRVVGLPGETVSIQRGTVYINGTALTEPYVHRQNPDWLEPRILLGPFTVYVIGDNRGMPIGDHVHGKRDQHLILGKVLF